MKTPDQQAVRTLVRTRRDFQQIRLAMDARLGLKANGKKQNIDDRNFMPKDILNFTTVSKEAKRQEKEIEKMLIEVLERFPFYNEFLKDVASLGPVGAGWIIGEFDIHEATTVSKMWQYAGLNPGLVKGKKRIEPKKHKGEKIVAEGKSQKGEKFLIIETNEMIRGDKKTAGFVSPYNIALKTAMLGIVGSNFVRSKQNSVSPYKVDFYLPYKQRLENSSKEVIHYGKPKPWKDVTPKHRHEAAVRYMIKMFLIDIYKNWREIEGLPVRASYQEEYLGHTHAA
jgi:hypothetical protein